MAQGIGIVITERIAVAVVSGNTISGSLRVHPDDGATTDSLRGVPAETIVQRIVEQVQQLGIEGRLAHVGLGMPGIIRNGIVEDSPNLVQFKGINMRELAGNAFTAQFGRVPFSVFNDADAMAAGIAATRGHLDRLIRVWTIGTGIETMLWANWFARGEYRYADFGTGSFTLSRIGAPPDAGLTNYDVKLRTHTALFGIAYKFN